MNERDTMLPLTFRAELLQQIMPALYAGECCSLMGIGGTGKSNLVRFLQRQDVQTHYWGDHSPWVVTVDTHGIVFGEQPAEFVIAELIMHRLIREVERRQMPDDLVAELDRLHSGLIAQPSVLLAMRYLERICARFCETGGQQLIFVFDQFEDLWKSLDARLFLNLRHLRDEFKYHLVYLVVTRERLQLSREHAGKNLAEVESFWELFNSHVFGLGMYNDRDATEMIERVAQRRQMRVNDSLRQEVLMASGGHSGLLRAIFWMLVENTAIVGDLNGMAEMRSVAEECAKIMADLLPDEQRLVRLLALDKPLPPEDDMILDELRLKEIVASSPPALFSPVFAAYLRTRSEHPAAPGVTVEPATRSVWVNDELLAAKLSPLEFKLLEYLAQNVGRICPREDVLRELYGEQMYEKNDERLDALLRRLREALGEEGRTPRYLVTVRGVGVKLTQGGLVS